MKKQITILLITLLLVNSGLSGIILNSWLFYRHHKIISKDFKPHKKNMVQFRFSNEEFAHLFFKKEKEFVYKNEMYDIKKKTVLKDSVVLLCYHDKHEKKSVEKFAENSEQKNKHNNTIVNSSLLIPLFCETAGFSNIEYISQIINYEDFECNPVNNYSECNTPPPDLI